MLPPMLLYVRVGSHERPGRGLWLPLFLVWLVLLPLVVLVLAVTVVVDAALFLAGQDYHDYTALLSRCFGVLGATRGTEVRIDANKAVIDICLA